MNTDISGTRVPTNTYSLSRKVHIKRSVAAIVVGIALLLEAMSIGIFPSVVGATMAHAAPANTAALTYKEDNGHTGQYNHETILNTSNVTVSQFGKRISYPVDGQVYAQPLYMPGLSINGATHNVVFVATEHDSVYAFDADQMGAATAPLWHTSFLTNGATSVPYTAISCDDLTPEIGITGTPVIDSSTNTMYIVSYTQENGSEVYRLHALNVTSGAERPGSPTVIQASVPGTAPDSSKGIVTLNPAKERQRSALLLNNGQIYISFASFCDNEPFHGWILSYTYNGSSFAQANVYNDTPNGQGGGIWTGLAADSSGNIYFTSGNGDFSLNVGGTNAGDALARLNPQLQLQDYFEPFNGPSCLAPNDLDIGSSGPLVLPSVNETIGGGKEGRIYVTNNAHMGKFTSDPNLNCSTTESQRTDIDQIVQEFPPATTDGLYGSTPAYWNGSVGQFVYFSGNKNAAMAYKLNNGLLSAGPISQTPENFSYPGGNPVVSSNGTADGTGIVWIIDPHAVLRAYAATNLGDELYNSNQDSSRDGLDTYVKFSAPTVANGEVFVGTADTLTIFGLSPFGGGTPTPTPMPPGGYNNIGISDDSAPTQGNFDYAVNSYSAEALQSAGIQPGAPVTYNGMTFTWPNAAAGQPDNYAEAGQTIPVTPVGNANVLGLLGSSTGGLASGTATINYTEGTTQPFTLSFSDWTLGGGSQKPVLSDAIAAKMGYRNTPTGKQIVNTYVFYTDIALLPGKTVKSITLPTTVNQGVLHVFAVSTKQQVSPVQLPYNNTGTSDDTAPGTGHFDGVNSYSVEALAGVGITPGCPLFFNGIAFRWPNIAAGQPDDYKALGQVIPIQPVTGATTLAFLGAATGGTSSGLVTITYTDGTTQTFTLGLTDWTLGNGTAPISFGNQVVVTMPYRNTPTGPQTHKPNVFYTDTALAAGKTVQSITLPSNTQLHIFAIATK